MDIQQLGVVSHYCAAFFDITGWRLVNSWLIVVDCAFGVAASLRGDVTATFAGDDFGIIARAAAITVVGSEDGGCLDCQMQLEC